MITSGLSQGHLCVRLYKLVSCVFSIQDISSINLNGKSFVVTTEMYVDKVFSPGKFIS